MKRIIAVAAICLSTLLSSCNDGDIVYKDINLDKITKVDRCGTQNTDKIFFKLNNDEALILQIDANEIMRDETKQEQNVEIDGKNTSLEYRKYADKVTSASICNTPPPGFPNVVKLLPASPGGTVQIRRELSVDNKTTTEVLGNNTVGLTYQFTFTLRNINFADGENNIKYDKMPFGTNNYASRVLNFKFVQKDGNYKPLNTCNNTLIALGDNEALILNMQESDMPKEEGTVTLPLSEVQNLVFKQYRRAGININLVCSNDGDIPGDSNSTINNLDELWTAESGNVSIESRWTTPADGGTKYLEHKLTLQNVTFSKNGVTGFVFSKPFIPFGTIRLQ